MAITTATLPPATIDLLYSTTLEASGGTPPYTWQGKSPAPPGLTLNSNGVISGVATYPAGTSPYQVSVRDASGEVKVADLMLTVEAQSGLRVTSLDLPAGSVGEPYSATLTAAGGALPYKFYEFFIRATNLPSNGLTLDSLIGDVSGVPLVGATGPLPATIRVRDVVGATAFASVPIIFFPGPLVITSDLPGGAVNGGYRVFLTRSGGVGNVAFRVAGGELPPGLRLLESTLLGWIIDGVPTTPGQYVFTIEATSGEQVATREYTVTIADTPIVVVTDTLPDGQVGTAYTAFLVASGGEAPYVWGLDSGELPPGVMLSGGGEISGTPTSAGSFSFSVRLTDQSGEVSSAPLTLQIAP